MWILRFLTQIKMSGRDIQRFGGGTSAYEAMLEKKRAALRQALRHEYIKTLYNPDLVKYLTRPESQPSMCV